MIRRIWIAYCLEIAKAARNRTTYAGPVLVILGVLATLPIRPIVRDGVADYAFVAYATRMTLDLVGLFLVVIYCASLVSSELSAGTARMMLVRPLRRTEFVVAKFLLGFSYGCLLTALAAVSSWGLLLLLGDNSGITYGGEVIYTARDMRLAYLGGLALSLAPLAATVAYGLAVSTLTRSSVGAVTAALGIWIVLDMAKRPLRIAPYLFTSYIETPWRVFADRCDLIDAAWLPEAQYCVLTAAPIAILLILAACVVLNKRDLHA